MFEFGFISAASGKTKKEESVLRDISLIVPSTLSFSLVSSFLLPCFYDLVVKISSSSSSSSRIRYFYTRSLREGSSSLGEEDIPNSQIEIIKKCKNVSSKIVEGNWRQEERF